MPRPVTITLAALLRARVLPDATDGLAELVMRAECGARLIGALALAATAPELPPAMAARVLERIKRSHLGTWGPITRGCIEQLRTGHPLASWRSLLSPDPVRQRRGLDRWLTDYETALRHAGRRPPPSVTGELRARLAAFLTAQCTQLVEAGPDVLLGGGDEHTVMRFGSEERATAPFLQLAGHALWLWDSPPKRGWRWLAYPLTGPGSTKSPGGAPEARTLASPEPPVGALLELHRRGSLDPVATFLGRETAADPPPDDAGLPVVVVDEVGLAERAEALVESWRSPCRAVLLIGVDGDEVALDQIQTIVGLGTASARSVLESWRRHHPALEAPVVGVVGQPRRVQSLVDARRALHGVASLVVITTSEHAFGHWSAAERRPLRVVRDGTPDRRPLAVSARLREGIDAAQAWIQGAVETFRLDEPDALDDLVALVRGADLLERARFRAYWEIGLVEIDRDGAARLSHPGWSALAAALAGMPCPETEREAWEAGRRMVAERAGA